MLDCFLDPRFLSFDNEGDSVYCMRVSSRNIIFRAVILAYIIHKVLLLGLFIYVPIEYGSTWEFWITLSIITYAITDAIELITCLVFILDDGPRSLFTFGASIKAVSWVCSFQKYIWIFPYYKETLVNAEFRASEPGHLGVFLLALAIFKALCTVGIVILGCYNVVKQKRLDKAEFKSHITIVDISQISCEDEENTCSICWDSISQENEVAELQCAHRFHFQCIENWIINKPQCPLCREIIFIRALI